MGPIRYNEPEHRLRECARPGSRGVEGLLGDVGIALRLLIPRQDLVLKL